jgi:hypothetical protein
MKKALIYLLSLIIIFMLNLGVAFWFFSNITLITTFASIINFIIYRFMSKKFKLNIWFFPMIITLILYLILDIWYMLTYRCTNCLDGFFIFRFLPVPIVSYLLVLFYEVIGKCIHAFKNKR